MLLLALLCVCLSFLSLILALKIKMMHKAAREIHHDVQEKLACDTNTLISLSSRDKVMRELAASLNVQLKELRRQRHRYVQGDQELKNAITNISHDLRTPLTAISGYLDLLERYEKSEDISRYLTIIQERMEVLRSLSEELFRYSIISSPDYQLTSQSVDMKRVLEDSLAASYATLLEKGITPILHICEEKVIKNLNEKALLRIFSNLLSNAIKYSDGDLDITLTSEGTIVVANTAKDLGEAEIGRLFDRFYTVETGRKATGLGLSIVKTLVEHMKGDIQASYEGDRLMIRIQFL